MELPQTNALAVSNMAGFIQPVIDVQTALRAYQSKKMIIEQIFKEGVDYGVIPGSSKPSLLKPGAEKSINIFGLRTLFVVEKDVEDWTGQDHGGEAFFYYRIACNVYQGPDLIVSLSASCNSWEKKYRYRWVEESKVPRHMDKSTLKSTGGRISEFTFAIEKGETAGQYGKPASYWQMWRDAIEAGKVTHSTAKSKSGRDMDKVEMDGTLYCLPNEDPADLPNTILKMAEKRALVGATLISTGLSEYYTQDIEDYMDPATIYDSHFVNVPVTPEPTTSAPKPVDKPASPAPSAPQATTATESSQAQPSTGTDLEAARAVLTSDGVPCGNVPSTELRHHVDGLNAKKSLTADDITKLKAYRAVLQGRAAGVLSNPA